MNPILLAAIQANGGDSGASGFSPASLLFAVPLLDAGAGIVNTTPSIGTGSATFTRATSSTTVLSTGLIGTVASGSPRSCYSPSGIYLGYLSEIASTNLILQSEDIANASWTMAAATIGAAIASPDGNVTAKKIQEDNTSARHGIAQPVTKAAAALSYTYSVYCKQAERTFVAISLDDGTANNGSVAWFNLATGVAGSNGLGGIYTTPLPGVSLSIVPAANGFFRCIVIATSTAGTTIRALVATATGDGVSPVFVGTTNSGLYAWGNTLEQAANPTSYIPTTTVAVTRNADVLTYPSAGNINNVAGSAYAECYINTVVGGTKSLIQGAAAEGALFVNGTPSGAVFDGTTVVAAGGSLSINVSHKVAGSWGVGAGINVAQDGGLAVNAAFDGSMNLTGIGIGCNTAGNTQLDGIIKNVKISNNTINGISLTVATR